MVVSGLTGIQMFLERKKQGLYYSENKLKIVDVWFRRGPFVLKFYPDIYVEKYSTEFLVMLNIWSALLFRKSFDIFGKTTGWMGLYRKTL